MGGRISRFFGKHEYTNEENELWEKYTLQFIGGITMTCRDCGNPNISRCECAKRKYLKDLKKKTNLKNTNE